VHQIISFLLFVISCYPLSIFDFKFKVSPFTLEIMLKKILILGAVLAGIGGGIGFYLWNKPHAAIGKPDVSITATELAAEFGKDEDAATKKFMGDASKTLIIQVSGKIVDVKNDTSGIALALETGDPINGVSCVLDKFTKQVRTDFKVGEEVTLKGICTGKLSDVVIDRCVPVQ
jgi:hypothetical protein